MEGSYAPHGTNASALPPPRDLIKKVVQECDCPFSFFRNKCFPLPPPRGILDNSIGFFLALFCKS